jgi:hypothetical protein
MEKKIGFNFLKPDQELSLDITIAEAEIMMCAKPELKVIAARGDFKKKFIKHRELKEKYKSEYMLVRD